MNEVGLQSLTAHIEALIELCTGLADENKLLRQQQTSLLMERDALLEKNSQARVRIETMIARLKAVENGTPMP